MRKPPAVLFLLLSCSFAFAQTPSADLKLIPAPREVQRKSGSFAIGASTRIVLASRTAAEDRISAEMLAEEIERATGRKPRITTGGASGSGLIFLGRSSADANARASNTAIADEEGYEIVAEPARVVITARTAAGVFYGGQTLRQLIQPGERGSASIPALTIRDWPAMRWRGVHIDLSRGPVPTLTALKSYVRTLAEYKINMFALYIEHVFDYEAHPLIAPKEGSLNAAEVRELVEYARRYHVLILPEQQAFGHLHHVLKSEVYSDLAETPHGHVLAPVNPQSYDLIKSLYAELVPLFPAPFFHIGSDETFELGMGQTWTRATQVGLGRVYLEHLQKVSEIMQPYHKRLMFWGDVAIKYKELLNILPKDMIAVAWEYDAQPDFTPKIKPFRDAGLDVVVSPGANNWNLIWPNFNAAFVNIRNFVRDGQKLGAIGMLNTTWADDGEALFGMTWPALVFGAQCSWQAGECSIEQFSNSYDWAFYRNNDSTFRDVILNLNRSHALLTGAAAGLANDDSFWLDPFTEGGSVWNNRALPAARDLRIAAERGLESLYRNGAKARLHADTVDFLRLAAMRLDALGMKIQFSTEISRYYMDAYLNMNDRDRVRRDLHEISAINARLEDLRDTTTRLRGIYSDVWLKENRPYWLQNVLVRYDTLAEIYQQKIMHVKGAQTQFRLQQTLPTPQQIGFYVVPGAPPVPATLPPPLPPPAGPVPASAGSAAAPNPAVSPAAAAPPAAPK